MIQLKLNADLTLSRPKGKELRGERTSFDPTVRVEPMNFTKCVAICTSDAHMGIITGIQRITRNDYIVTIISGGSASLTAFTTIGSFPNCDLRIGSEYRLAIKKLRCFQREVVALLVKASRLNHQ